VPGLLHDSALRSTGQSCRCTLLSFFFEGNVALHCEVQAALREARARAASELAEATRALTKTSLGTMSNPDLMALRARAEEARQAAENARVHLDLHRREHGC
jgi:hypothetical protein